MVDYSYDRGCCCILGTKLALYAIVVTTGRDLGEEARQHRRACGIEGHEV